MPSETNPTHCEIYHRISILGGKDASLRSFISKFSDKNWLVSWSNPTLLLTSRMSLIYNMTTVYLLSVNLRYIPGYITFSLKKKDVHRVGLM